MSLSHHPSIPRNGLVFCSDPANYKSYPSSQDPYVNSVSLMLDGESLTDKSLNNLTITNNGASVSSSQFKFGSNSLYFNGTTSSLQITSSLFNFSSSDATVEFWFFTSDINSVQILFEIGNGSAGDWNAYIEGGFVKLSTVNNLSIPTLAISANTWIHFAASSTGGAMYFFINGVKSTVLARTLNSSTTLNIGSRNNSTYRFNGYIDDFRVTKGYARYTANFTPPNASLPLPNTSTDLTRSKFPVSYSSGVTFNSSNGGTISLDGSAGSGVTNSVLTVGPTSTFTMCAWAKWNTTATAGAARRPAISASVLTNNFEFTLGFPYIYSSSKLALEVGKAGVGSQTAYSINSTPTGVWYHLAGVYKNGSADFYLNGVYQSSITYNATVNSATTTSGNWLLGVELYNGANTIGSMNGNVGPTQVYNRILTSGEIFQNYTALKGRFGL